MGRVRQKEKRKWIRKSEKTWVKKEKEAEREEDETVVKRKCVNPVWAEAIDIFS